MKKLIYLMSFLFTGLTSHAQSVATPTKVEIKNSQADALKITFSISENNLEDIFKEKMKTIGADNHDSKSSLDKKFAVYEGSLIVTIDNKKMDFYYQIDGDKNTSSIVFFMSTGYSNFINQNDHAQTFAKAKAMLESLNEDIYKFQLKESIALQEKVLSKANDQQKDLENDLNNLNNKKSDIEQKIENTKAAIEQQKNKVNEEKNKLDLLKSKL